MKLLSCFKQESNFYLLVRRQSYSYANIFLGRNQTVTELMLHETFNRSKD